MPSLSRTFATAIFAALGESYPACRGFREVLSSPDAPAFIPLASLAYWFDQAAVLSDDPGIGLRTFEHAHPANLGPLGYALMSSPDIRSVLDGIAEHHHLIGTGFCLFVEERAEGVRLVGVQTGPAQQPLPRVFIDAISAITLGLLCWLVPGTVIRPMQAELSYPRPQDTHAVEALFGDHIEYGAARNALLFSHAVAALPVATHDPALHAMHSQYLAQWRQQLNTDLVSLRVRRVISEQFALGQTVNLTGVADSLGFTPSQLSRGLEAEGHSFLRLLDEVRLRDSHNLLRSSTLSLKQIAYQVGFRHQSAFNKACERWFGMGPGQYREQGD